MAESFEIHGDLVNSCVQIRFLRLSHLLLMNDATYPWLVLVPSRPNKRDFHDLDPMDQYRVCDEITLCCQALSRLYSPHKMNVASLGNQTPQLHIHLIARFEDDAAWPTPVWGKVPQRPYPPDELVTRVEELRREIRLPL